MPSASPTISTALKSGNCHVSVWAYQLLTSLQDHNLGFTLGVSYSMGFDKCLMTCIHADGIRVVSIPPFLLTSGNHRSFYCLHSFAFPECHIAFSDRLLSLSCMYSRFLRVFSRLDSSFLFSVNIPSSGCTTIYLFTLRISWLLPSFGNYE